MRRIFFITQYFDVKGSKDLGGVLIRKKQIELFIKNGYEVQIIMPSKFHNKITIENNITYIPYFHQKKICDILERLSVWPDIAYDFSEQALKYLKDKINKNDILFCITGGSLECIVLGSKLKNIINCKFVINYQDPINHTKVNGFYVDRSIRFKRNRQEEKYIKNVDLIITSSESNKSNLLKKFNFLNDTNTINSYYGFIKAVNCKNEDKQINLKINLMYSGIYGKHQQPEKFVKIIKKLSHYTLYLLGNSKNYKPLKLHLSNNIIEKGFLPHAEFLAWVQKNIDVGIVSLNTDYLGACVPSKIYEYINLNLPIIGFLPNGDAKDIINSNGFGKIFDYNDLSGFEVFLKDELNIDFINECKINLATQKKYWSMDYRFNEILKSIELL